jgi:hypothetical protein
MQLRDEYWGLAGLTGFHTVAENGTGGAGMITGDRGGKKGRWERIPKLEEAETEGFAKGYKDELFEDITVCSTPVLYCIHSDGCKSEEELVLMK